jgi:hypothetical protein
MKKILLGEKEHLAIVAMGLGTNEVIVTHYKITRQSLIGVYSVLNQ